MANYDASIRVNTKVDNSDLRKLEREINNTAQNVSSKMSGAGNAIDTTTKRIQQQEGSWDSLSAKAEDYKTRLRALEDKGFGFGDEKYDDLYIAWQNAERAVKKYRESLNSRTEQGIAEEAARAAREQERQSVALRKTREGFTAVERSGKKCFNALDRGAKKTGGLLKTLGSRLKGIALSLLVFNWITKGFNAMVNAIKEGFQNLAQYSDEYNNSMSELKGQSAQLKNALAAAFEPIANMVIPYLTKLVQWLNVAIDSVGQFLAALQGKSTYTKAKKQVIDYADSLDKASKAAKRALASFDQLNVLNKDNSVSGDGALIGADAFETVEISNGISKLATEVLEALRPFKEAFAEWQNDLNFEPLITSVGNLRTACEPFMDDIYDGLLAFQEEVLQPLGAWVIEDAAPASIDTLADAFEGLGKIIDVIKPSLEKFWDNVLKPIGEFSAEGFTKACDEIGNKFQELADTFEENGEEINNILSFIGGAIEFIWNVIAKPTLQFLAGGISKLVSYIIILVGDIIGVFSGLIDFIKGVFTGEWAKAWDGISRVVLGVVDLIYHIVEGIINIIIAGINALEFTVPEWVPGIGGKRFDFDIEEFSFEEFENELDGSGGGGRYFGPPKTSNSVIYNGDAFAAVVGRMGYSQKNQPAISDLTPEMIAQIQAAQKAGGNYTFIAQLDGKTIFEETVRQDQMYQEATGQSAFGY